MAWKLEKGDNDKDKVQRFRLGDQFLFEQSPCILKE